MVAYFKILYYIDLNLKDIKEIKMSAAIGRIVGRHDRFITGGHEGNKQGEPIPVSH